MLATIVLLELLAFVGGRVHTQVPGELPREAVVLVEDGLVRGVVDAVPEGARAIDVTGLHLVPGLIDGFAYHDRAHDALYVASGVTTVRDHGNDLGRIFESRDLARAPGAVGPDLSISGAVLDGLPPSTSAAIVLEDAAAARGRVTRLIDEGVDFLAFQAGIGEETWREVLRVAHEPSVRVEARTPEARGGGRSARVQVWGPLPKGVDLATALEAGQDGVLFLDGLLPRRKGWEEVELAQLQGAVELLAGSGARLTPLLSGNARILEEELPRDELRYLGPQYHRVWNADPLALGVLDDGARERGAVVLAKQRAVLRDLHRAGVPLVPGSGAAHPWLFPGRGLVRELVAFQESGLPPAEVLRLATAGAAEALGLGDRGRIAPGLRADLVAVEGDPTADVGVFLDGVRLVVRAGLVLERSALDEELARIEAAQAQLREEAERPIEVGPLELPDGEVLLSGLSETRSAAGRLAAERWAVVRPSPKALEFCGRKHIPAEVEGAPPVEVHVRQRLSNGRLDSFSVRVEAGGHELKVRGVWTAGQMRVERRVDGSFVDNRAARERIVAIDAGSVTTAMLLGQSQGAGHFPVLWFDEGLELEVVRWDLSFDDDGEHIFRTPQGGKIASLREDGAPRVFVEQKGHGSIETHTIELDVTGEGVPLPPEKLAMMKLGRGIRPREASTPEEERR